MDNQVRGISGRLVDGMIRRTVRRRFRNVYWSPPRQAVSEPAIFVPNHHGWHDGYLMYIALCELQLRGFHDWIQEFDAFPLFGSVGGMPFPSDDPGRRAATIRRTIRLMRNEKRSLLLFAEGVLHRPPELLPFGKSLELLVAKVPGASVIPVGIKYELALHERPEAYLFFGEPVEIGPDLGRRTRLKVASLLDQVAATIAVDAASFQVLQRGTKDVNERMDMRKLTKMSRRSKNGRSLSAASQKNVADR